MSIDGGVAYWAFEILNRKGTVARTVVMRRTLPYGPATRVRTFKFRQYGFLVGLRARGGHLAIWFTKGFNSVQDRGWDQSLYAYDTVAKRLRRLDGSIFPGKRSKCGFEIDVRGVSDAGEIFVVTAQPPAGTKANPCRSRRYLLSGIGIGVDGEIRNFGSQLVGTRDEYDREQLMLRNYVGLPIVVEGDYAIYFDPASSGFFQPGNFSPADPDDRPAFLLKRFSNAASTKISPPAGNWTGDVAVTGLGQVLVTTYADRDGNDIYEPEAHLYADPENGVQPILIPSASEDENAYVFCGGKPVGFTTGYAQRGKGSNRRTMFRWRVRQFALDGSVLKDSGDRVSAAELELSDCDASGVGFSSYEPVFKRQPRSGISNKSMLPDYWRYFAALQ